MARLKDIDIVEPIVTIKGKMKASDEIKLKELADSLLSTED